MKTYIRKKIHLTYFLGCLLIPLLLVGCQSEEGEPEIQTSELHGKESQKNEVTLPVSDEEWKVFVEESRWFDSYLPADADRSELLLADLLGDEKPEAVIPYILQGTAEGDTFGILIGSYDDSQHEWLLSSDYKNTEPRMHINEIQPLGKMISDEGKDVIFLVEELVSASTLNKAVHIFQMNSDKKILIHSAELSADHTAPVELNENQLTFTEDSKKVSYKREEVNWLIGNGFFQKVYLKQAPSIYEEAFMKLLGDHSILQARVDLTEGYEEAKSRLGTPRIEDYDLGGLCAQYADYNFCNNGQDNQIVHISLQVDPKFTIEEVKPFLGEPDDTLLWDIEDNYYMHNYTLGDMKISYLTADEDPNSAIEEILIMPARSEDQY